MRTHFIAALTIKTALCFPLWAAPVPGTGGGPARSITQLLERLSANISSPVTWHYACQTSNNEYGLEAQLWDSRSYCQYLSQGTHKFSEEFTLMYLDEETLNASVKEFLNVNNRTSKNYWVFKDNHLRYVYNSGARKEHILLSREPLLNSGSGLETPDNTDTPGAPGTGMKVDVGATIVGASLILLASTVIVISIVTACREDILNLIGKRPLPIPLK